MEPVPNWIDYAERLNRVIAYIHANLDEALSFEKMAEIAYLSPYHFHRIYRAARGETIAATVRRLRLYRAARSACTYDDADRRGLTTGRLS